MKHDIETLLASLKGKLFLTREERGSVRMHLAAFMRRNSVTFPGKSGLLSRGSTPASSLFKNLFTRDRNRMAPLAIGLILALSAGGGVALAAEGAIPGDILYPIKVNVAEKVESAFAVSDTAKANLETRFANERLKEALELASRGSLDARARADLEGRFNTHVESAERHIAKLRARGDAKGVTDVEGRLESSFDVHAIAFMDLDASASVGTSTKIEVRGILNVIKRRAADVRGRSHNEDGTSERKNRGGTEDVPSDNRGSGASTTKASAGGSGDGVQDIHEDEEIDIRHNNDSGANSKGSVEEGSIHVTLPL
ncbi:MAG: DUF5667 domain-containing protein [bacterium]|nr:DUF5667 domain-containing protein [bacterium]